MTVTDIRTESLHFFTLALWVEIIGFSFSKVVKSLNVATTLIKVQRGQNTFCSFDEILADAIECESLFLKNQRMLLAIYFISDLEYESEGEKFFIWSRDFESRFSCRRGLCRGNITLMTGAKTSTDFFLNNARNYAKEGRFRFQPYLITSIYINGPYNLQDSLLLSLFNSCANYF